MRLLRGVFLNRIYRFGARMVCDVGNGGGRSRLLPFRLLSRRSGCVPALPYPPLRCFQSGSHQPRRAMIFHRTATTPLTFCLTPGVHRTSCSTFNTSRSRRVNNKFSSSIRSSSRLSRGSSHFALRGISHFAATSSPHPPHILCHILGCLNVFGMAGNLLEVPFTPALDSR